MGQWASKRVKSTLQTSPQFTTSCNTVYTDSLTLTQHSFNGLKPYQLFSATQKLHTILLTLKFPLISTWVPFPPSRNQVDRVVSNMVESDDEMVLDESAFKAFAVQVFADAVVSSAGMGVVKRVGVGVVGIAGVGGVVRSGKGVVVGVIGAYAVGVVGSVFIGLAHG